MSIDLSQDWQLVEGPQTAKLHPRTGEGSYGAPVEVTNCNRQLTATGGLEAGDEDLETRSTTWDLWAAKLGGAVPKMGDVLEDAAGVRWNVKAVDHCDRDAAGVQRYQCLCLRED